MTDEQLDRLLATTRDRMLDHLSAHIDLAAGLAEILNGSPTGPDVRQGRRQAS